MQMSDKEKVSSTWFSDEAMKSETLRDAVRLGMNAMTEKAPETDRLFWKRFLIDVSGIDSDAETDKANDVRQTINPQAIDIKEIESTIRNMSDDELEQSCKHACTFGSLVTGALFIPWTDGEREIDEDGHEYDLFHGAESRFIPESPKFFADVWVKLRESYKRFLKIGMDP